MATTWRNKKNYPLGVGSLNADINSSTLTIVLSSGQGANFPSATFTITIDEEIILIDSRSTDTLTANASGRGYDSTTAAAHAAAATVANYQIVKDFTDLETAVNTVENIIGGVNPIADDTYLKFGTDTDVKIGYDETTNDRLDFRDASNNVLAFLKDNGTTGLWGVTGRAEIPQIGISSDTDLLTLTADLLTIAGDLAVNGGDQTSSASTFNLLVSTVATLNVALAATSFNFGSNSNTVTYNFLGNSSSSILLGNCTTLRSASGTMTLMGLSTALTIGATTGTCNIRNAIATFDGDVKLVTVGKGLYVKQGTNATFGRATLVGGTVTVSTTKATTTMEVFLSRRTLGGTAGNLSIGTITGGTSFVINSSSGTDTSDVSWWIIEPA